MDFDGELMWEQHRTPCIPAFILRGKKKWRRQVNYPGASSTVETPSGPGDVPLWGSHPLIPAIACLLTGKTPGDLTGDPSSLRYNRMRRERGGFIDWMANQLNTGPYPVNHVRGRMDRGGGGGREEDK